MEDYLKKMKKPCDMQSEESFPDSKEKTKNDKDFIQKLEKMNFNVSLGKKKKMKKANLMVWISDEFPLKFSVTIIIYIDNS